MIIYGKNAIREAILSGKTINKIFVESGPRDNVATELLSLARDKKIKVVFENKNNMLKKANTTKHQGFVAEITDFEYSSTSDILKLAEARGEQPFVIILDSIMDPHNLGAIVRTAEAVGAHGIILQKDRAVSVNETVYKTSAGAISNMKVARVTNLTNEINYLKKQGLWVYGLELGGSDIYETNLKGAIALVVGSEGFGIKDLVKKNCDGIITLQMKGQVNSLNASVACGIALYEIARQRNL